MYKVSWGYNDPTKQVSVAAGPDLERVIYAKLKGQPVEVNGKIFDGKHIIDITPDYHYYTGWYPSYQPRDADDWKQIDRDCPPQIDKILSLYSQRVRELVQTGQTRLIGRGEPVRLEENSRTGSVYAQKLLETKQ